jgi:predicted Zn-ribbon and HTH transcriptional regulator
VTRRINLDNGTSVIAHNRCNGCGHEWHDKPMGFARHIECPRCGSEYWAWINYVRPDSGEQ